MGHPLPLGTLTSPPLRQRRRRTQLGRARPPHGRVELLAKQRQPGVLHSRLRSTSPRRRLPLRPLSEWEWPSTPRGPSQGGFASLSEVAAALPSVVSLGGLEAAAMEVDPEPSPAHGGIVTPPANPGSPEYSPSGHQPSGSANAEVVASTPQTTQPASPPADPGPHAASAAAAQDSAQEGTPPVVLSPTSPAEPAKEGGGAATPVVASTPPATAPAVPVPEGEPRLLRLDVSCQVGTHLVVLRMAMTANSTISSLISKARERASAPELMVASLHGSPDVELPHAATLGAVLPQGELRLLLREGPSTAAPSGANLAQGAAEPLLSRPVLVLLLWHRHWQPTPDASPRND